MDVSPKQIRIYEAEDGRSLSEWMDQQDSAIYGKVMTRLERAELGNLGDHRSVGDGVFELRIDFGPGYRIYFGLDGIELVILLVAGSKKTQHRDIDTAKKFWRKYNA